MSNTTTDTREGRVRWKRAKGFTTRYRFLNARRTSAWLAVRGIDLADPTAVTRLLALEHTTP